MPARRPAQRTESSRSRGWVVPASGTSASRSLPRLARLWARGRSRGMIVPAFWTIRTLRLAAAGACHRLMRLGHNAPMPTKVVALVVLSFVALAIAGCSQGLGYSVVGSWGSPSMTPDPETNEWTFRFDGTFEYNRSAGPFKNGRSSHMSMKGTYKIDGSRILTTVSGGSRVTTNADGTVYRRTDIKPSPAETASMEWADADHLRLVPIGGENASPLTLTRHQTQ